MKIKLLILACLLAVFTSRAQLPVSVRTTNGTSVNQTLSGTAIFSGNGTPAVGNVPTGTDGAGNWNWAPQSGGGGGSQTPWTNTQNAANFNLTNLDFLLFTGSVIGPNFGGGSFFGDGGGLTNIAHTNVNGDVYVTPYDFGAVGNGTADDTSAVQAWVNYGEANSINLHVPVLQGGGAATFKLTSAIKINYPALTVGQFPSWQWIGDGGGKVTFWQSNTNADMFVVTNGQVAGWLIHGIGFEGALTGTNPCITRGIAVTNGAGNNNDVIENCVFNYLPTAMSVYIEDSTIRDCVLNDCPIGLWFPNTGAGNNNVNIINVESTEGIYGSLIAGLTNISVRIDGGGGHNIIGCSFNSMATNAGSAGVQLRGAGVSINGLYGEMNGGVPLLDDTTGANAVTVVVGSAITGGSLSNTNQYPIINGASSSLTLVGYQNYGGWGSKSQVKTLNGNVSYVSGNGQLNADLYSGSTYQGTYPIPVNYANGLVLPNISNAATNTITSLSETLVVNGTQVHSMDSSGNVSNATMTLTASPTGAHQIGYYTGGAQLQMNAGTGGIQFNNDANLANLFYISDVGNAIFQASGAAVTIPNLNVGLNENNSGAYRNGTGGTPNLQNGGTYSINIQTNAVGPHGYTFSFTTGVLTTIAAY